MITINAAILKKTALKKVGFKGNVENFYRISANCRISREGNRSHAPQPHTVPYRTPVHILRLKAAHDERNVHLGQTTVLPLNPDDAHRSHRPGSLL